MKKIIPLFSLALVALFACSESTTSPSQPTSTNALSSVGLASSSSTLAIACSNLASHEFCDTRDGKSYPFVVIGSQTWMAKNLNYGTKILNTVSHQSNDGVIEKYCYNDDDANCEKYGGLYQWAEAMAKASACSYTLCEDKTETSHQGICPSGWHLPTDNDWTNLSLSLGSQSGKKIKAKSPEFDGNDDYGFNALPAGVRMNEFSFLGTWGYFWTASENLSSYGWHRYLAKGMSDIGRGNDFKTEAYSVRCVQD